MTSTGSYSIGFAVGALILAFTFAMSATMPETLRRAEAIELGTGSTDDDVEEQTPQT